MSFQSQERGFTLIELMIVVAVVAIISAIAYPSYKGAMVKNRRAAAQAHLADLAQRQHQYVMDARAYAGTVAALNAATPNDVGRYYTITVEAAVSTPPSFTVTAAPLADQSQAADGSLSINHTGEKAPACKWGGASC